jgi:GNAT superfamily N-acetyltransferase
MQIPDLTPDIQFELMSKAERDFEFSLAAKKAALGPYISERWGWDDEFQRAVHRARFSEKPFFKIVRREQALGTVSLMQRPDHVRFGEFYLFPESQRQGLGTRILRHCIALSDAIGLPVRLEYLKWNPVGSLYRRHGFRVIGETDIHRLMERPPGSTA